MWYQRNPQAETYTLKIRDVFSKEVDTGKTDDNNEPITKIEREIIYRELTTLSDEKINFIASLVPIDLTDKTKLTENLDQILLVGLLEKTKFECRDGKGVYFSEENDWELANK